jgi:adenosine kinase
VPGTRTAQCFITTDLDDNQIVAFHPGAMLHSHDNALPEDEEVRIALVGPDGRDGMLAHVERLTARGIDVLFDPGQALPLFSGDELLQIIGRVRYLAVNDYEARLLASKTGRSIEEMARGLSALVVTRGAEGSVIHHAGRQLQIPAAPARAVIDPTGCGDAFRAGLLTGLARGLDWETTGRLGSVMGALKIEHPGAQNHAPSREQVLERFAEAFGYRPF